MKLFQFTAALLLVGSPGLVIAQPAALGVQLNDIDSPGKLLVHKVMPGLTGEIIGLKEGDEVLAVSGKTVSDADAVVALMQTVKAGDPISVTVRRADQQMELRGKASARPDNLTTGRILKSGE